MKVIAHRGLHDYFKKNTREALVSALSMDYIAGIELDVRITKDKKIVIIHDPLIDFVSDGHGFVRKLTYRKLLKYNFGTKNNPEKLMLLDNFLKELSTNKIIMIDIKEETNDYKDLADQIIKIISKCSLNIYLCSFNYELIKYLSDYNSGLLIGLSINKKRLYNSFRFNIVHYNYANRINKRKETFVWGVNDKEDLDKVNNPKALIITDYPKKIFELIDEQPLI